MASVNYQTRRDEIETYFDRTAADAWAALTSDAPVSRIRRTVRRGRDAMRETLMGWLPEDLTGSTLIDAGCGTGTLAIEAAQRSVTNKIEEKAQAEVSKTAAEGDKADADATAEALAKTKADLHLSTLRTRMHNIE